MATATEISYPPEHSSTAPSTPPKTHDFGSDDGTRHIEIAHPTSPNGLSLPISAIPTATSGHTNGSSYFSGKHTTAIGLSQKSSSTLRRTRSALGLPPDAPLREDDDVHERQRLWWSRVRIALREPFMEFWGVMIMILFGDGSVAQVLLSTGQTTAPGGNGFGGYQSISWG